MQEIFYNGNIITNNDNNEVMEAMIINDGSVFFVGQNDEVLNLKTDETKVNDLKQKYIYPTAFDLKTNIFNQIEQNLRKEKKIKKFQVSADINEDYENFENFEEYKKEYIKLENEYVKNGITTIVELNIDKLQFAFWKKMSEEKFLNIDVVCYVDFLDSKQVMDDNCVTYRKYKNRVRLGGYYVKVDGKLSALKAWLNKPYSGTKSSCGSGELYGEQLFYIVKTALEEKKQLYFEANGDKAIREVLTVLKEVEEKEKITEFFRPIIYGAELITKKIYADLKHFDVTLLLEEYDKKELKQLRRFIGFRRKRHFHNYKSLLKNGIKFITLKSSEKIQNISSWINLWFDKKRKLREKYTKNNEFKIKFESFLQKMIYINPAYICFDQDTKAGLETQKQANFMIVNKSLFDRADFKKNINSVYIFGEKKC